MSRTYQEFLAILKPCMQNKFNTRITDINPETGVVLGFSVDGFCKHGHMSIYFGTDKYEVNKITITDRYNKVEELYDFDDLVSKAWYTYQTFKDRGYEMPSEWRDDFIRLGYIVPKTVTIYEEVK